MKRIQGDARLAFPVVGAMASAVLVLLAGAQDAGRTGLFAWLTCTGCLVIVVMALLFLRGSWRSVVMSTAMMALALCLLIALRAPYHVVVKPWQVADEPVDIPRFLEWTSGLRAILLQHTSALPGVGGQLVPGLVVGDTSRVSASLTAAMKTASLTHITAVSGANCAIVTLSIMAIAARLRCSRRWRLAIGSAALVAFVALVTPQPSVVRAAVMSVVVMLSLFCGRPGSGLPLLSVAAYSMLLWDPWWVIDFGFILSVLATVGLLVFSGPLTSSLGKWMPNLLAMAIAIPLSAQLLCQPALILLSPRIPLYGILANVLAAPAAPLATIVGLIALLLLPIFPWLADVFLWLCWLPAEWIGQCALLVSRLPVPFMPWLDGFLGMLLACGASVGILWLCITQRKRARRFLLLGGAALGVLLVITLGVSRLGALSNRPTEWVIANCDVGQGDAFFIRSQDKFALVDTGKSFDAITKCMSELHITVIELLVLTHYDQDHVGAIAALYGRINHAIVGPADDSRGDKIVSELSRSGASVVRGIRGMSGALGEVRWSVLWPTPEHPTMQSGNPGSIAIQWTFTGGMTAIFLADLGEDAQRTLSADHVLSSVDVVKVAHHGSADQSESLYRLLAPKLAMISVGKNNGYGHPTDKLLDILKRMGTMTTRTDEEGLVLVSEHGSALSVWTERGG